MITNDEAVDMSKFDEMYKAHANNIYKICLYYLRDEKQASDLAVKVFCNYYLEYGEENSQYTFPLLVHEVKRLLKSEYGKSIEVEEQRE